MNWVLSLSHIKSNTDEDGSTINEKKSGSAHTYDNVNKSTGGLVMVSLFFLLFATGYLGYRVYFQRKYLSEGWKKEYGKKGGELKVPQKEP